MAISKRAIDLTDGIYVAYGSGSGYLFGIQPDKKEAVKAVVQVILDRVENAYRIQQADLEISRLKEVNQKLLEACKEALFWIAPLREKTLKILTEAITFAEENK
jgi:hypothetical protein